MIDRLSGINNQGLCWKHPADLSEWSRNPKQHDAGNVEALARSLRRYGFVAPVVVWGSRRQIVAGHGRHRAAMHLLKLDPGMLLASDAPGPALIPVRVVEFASDAEADMYAIEDNRATEANPMDPAAVAEILRGLDAAGVDIEIPAYSDAEIAGMLTEPSFEPTDTAPDLSEVKPYHCPHCRAPITIKELKDSM